MFEANLFLSLAMKSSKLCKSTSSLRKGKSVVTITFAIICGPQGGALFTVITWGIQQGKEQEIGKKKKINNFRFLIIKVVWIDPK